MSKKKSGMQIYTKQDKAILYCGYALLAVFLIAIIVPMVYIVIASFMDPVTLQNKGISFDFSKWSLDAYERVISDKQIWVGFKNAVLYSVIFTVISVAVTMLAAYPMSLPDFKGKKFFNTLFVITMFFNGGLIPTYLLINNIGLLDSMWAVILPGAFSVWNMIIARTYYQGIPRELREAADVDGASEMRYFFNILLPVCMPVVAVLALWQFVAMWNSYFDAMIYLNSASKQPLQLVLRSILIQSQPESGMIADIQSTAERAKMAELLKYATIIISSLPLLVMYPFFQKYYGGLRQGLIVRKTRPGFPGRNIKKGEKRNEKIDFTLQFPQNGRLGERCYDAGRLRRRCRRRKRFGCQCRCYRCRFVSSGGAGNLYRYDKLSGRQ